MSVFKGLTFGRWRVISDSERYSKSGTQKHWLCQCDCGKKKWVSSYALKKGKTKGCLGCPMRKKREKVKYDLKAGMVFGSWTILDPKRNNTKGCLGGVLCKCVCGAEKYVAAADLVNKNSTRCNECRHKAQSSQIDIGIARRMDRLEEIVQSQRSMFWFWTALVVSVVAHSALVFFYSIVKV